MESIWIPLPGVVVITLATLLLVPALPPAHSSLHFESKFGSLFETIPLLKGTGNSSLSFTITGTKMQFVHIGILDGTGRMNSYSGCAKV